MAFDTQTATNWLTFCLVVITAIYCFYTFKMVQKTGEMVHEMRAQYEALTGPSLSISILIRHGCVMCLRITNTGKAAAKNLRLSLDRDFYQFSEFRPERNIRNFPSFREPIPSFSSGEELFFMLSQGFNLETDHQGQTITPKQFNIEAEYEFAGKKIKQQHEVNLQIYMMSSQNKNEALEELEKIRKALERRS